MNGSAETNGISTTTAPGLSADEIALYDRQIRLWGAQAQERIRSANILLVSLRALGTEIAKNLTLAGISSLTIIDDEPVTEEDLGAQYFLREEDVGKSVSQQTSLPLFRHPTLPTQFLSPSTDPPSPPQRAEAAIPRLRDLNPRVTITSNGSLSALLLKDQTYYTPFSCIIAADHDFMTLSLINTAARFANRPFYAAGIHGFYGFIFADLVVHEFVIERDAPNVATEVKAETGTRSVVSVTTKKDEKGSGKRVEIVRKQEIYCPLILANTSPLPADVLASRRKLKSVPPLLPCLRALFDFQRTFSRLPSHTSQDLAIFTTLATAKSRELQLPAETLRSEFLRSFIQNIGAEIVPTAAFVGGRLSEDVINVLGKREQPVQNFALFDGEGLEGRIFCLWSAPPEVALAGEMDGEGIGMGVGSGMDGQGGLGQVDGLQMMGQVDGVQMTGQVDGAQMTGSEASMGGVVGNGVGLAAGPTSAPADGAGMDGVEG